MNQYLALLRGINVGGNNIIKMADLKKCFENMGFQEVVTYIQSGNVIFKTKTTDIHRLTTKIEQTLSKMFNYKSLVVLITQQDLEQVITEAPPQFGNEKEKFRYDVLYVKFPLVAKKVITEIPKNEEVDTSFSGTHAIYFSRLIEKNNRSYLSKLIKLPVYKNITVRNWNTTTKLLELMKK